MFVESSVKIVRCASRLVGLVPSEFKGVEVLLARRLVHDPSYGKAQKCMGVI
jgi:hypothetical protein